MTNPLEFISDHLPGTLSKKEVAAILSLLVFGFALKLIRLDVPNQLYFDEAYYGFTAEEYLKGNKDSYNPFASPPPNVAYEWTHPPTGKLLVAGTMAIFGPSFFSMRLSSVFFGTLCILLAFILSLLLFDSFFAAFFAAVLLTFEGLFFTMSRITMTETHFMTFVLGSLCCYVYWRQRKKASFFWFLGAAVLAGLALSTKWTGLYLLLFLGADLVAAFFYKPLRMKRKQDFFLYAAVALLFFPPIVYFLSYLHYFYFGYSWAEFKELQRQMWYYHTHLVATHGYQSKPWQWVLNLRPVWFYGSYPTEKAVSNIFNLGNSVILYFGLFALIKKFVDWIRDREWTLGFVLAAYFAFWLPWVVSPRIMFFYHYFPAIPFLAILSGLVLDAWRESPKVWVRAGTYSVIGLAVLWFAFFYPHQTAIVVPTGFNDAAYYWLPGWR